MVNLIQLLMVEFILILIIMVLLVVELVVICNNNLKMDFMIEMAKSYSTLEEHLFVMKDIVYSSSIDKIVEVKLCELLETPKDFATEV